ncbi:MAG: glycoside hydrolase family 127 protein, partial [Oscillospiraceae bacterium]|nr:glycoside hydrolase family 127 protein [Oscillospiraceae bacterium]
MSHSFHRLHANQHIPQIMGAMLEYEASGEERYRRIASSFLSRVLSHHLYAIGGVGQGECFR